MARLHPTAAAGFEAAAGDYDRFRPGYPTPAIETLARGLDLRAGRTVLDLAAGTGKLTRPLVATGAQVVAVEPVNGMRQHLLSALPGVATIDGTAEALPLPDASMDAVCVAQAFHWFDGPRALAEVRRVLAPGGGLGVLFNLRDLETPVQAALNDLLAPFRRDTPSWADDRWQQSLDAADGFTCAERDEWPHLQCVDEAGFVGRVLSVSFVATLDDATSARLVDRVRDVFVREQRDGTVALAYRTQLWVLRRAD